MSTEATRCTTNKVRLSYCHLFTPRPARNPGDKAKYAVTILIPKSDADTLNRINAAIQSAINEGTPRVWGGTRPPQPAIPIHDGDGVKQTGEPFGEECRGCYVLTASDEMPPKLVDVNLNPIIDQTQMYSGCYGRVGIRFFAYSNQGKRGVGCGLDAVQKLEDGTPLGGRGPVDPTAIFGGAPAYGAPAAPQYAPQQPAYPQPMPSAAYGAPATPQYAPQQPAYQPAYQQPMQQPAYAPAPAAPQQQINPITGQPMAAGGILGL